MREEYKDGYANAEKPELEKIDISGFLIDLQHGVKKLWWLVILLAVLSAARSYFATTISYEPQYEAYAVATVSSVTGTSASDMATIFPNILESGVLEDAIKEQMNVDYMPGTIRAEADEQTNLLTIYADADDPEVAYRLLQNVIEYYPEVAEFVVGETKLNVLDESGIPTDTQREQIIRGSYKRGALKGALLGLLIMALYVVTRRTVKERKDLRKLVNIPDLGSIPMIQIKKRRRHGQSELTLMNERIPQGYVEAVRKLRIKVTKTMEDREFKTVLITSSIPGEGKSTVAANLAISIAEQGNSVILVDCDIRNPSIAEIIGDKEKHIGLDELLSDHNGLAKLPQALVPMKVKAGRMHVIFGGEGDADAQLLATKDMKQLLAQLREMADIVILDTAPSGLLADAPVLARYVESAIYVVRYDFTRQRQIKEGVEALGLSGIYMLGYVFNGDTKDRNRGYGYGYGYGYSRYSSYGKYGSYAKRKTGVKDKSGRVIKE